MIGMIESQRRRLASRAWHVTACRLSMVGLSLALLILDEQASLAQSPPVTTASAPIAKLQSDWNASAVIVTLSSGTPFVNPASCALTSEYETNPTDPGAALNQSMLISAYMNHSNVALAIQGCSISQRPRIAGVSIPN